jgi:hypothetical protein
MYNNLTYSFSIYIHFISFSCLVDLAKNLRTIVNKSVECRHLFLILEEMHCFSLFSVMLTIDLSYVDFISLSMILLFLIFSGLLSIKECWILTKIFSVSMEMIT